MADPKTQYQAALATVQKAPDYATCSARRRALKRKKNHGKEWYERSVNIIETVAKFAPGVQGKQVGSKFMFKGSRYWVIADPYGNYLRVRDMSTNKYVYIDGTPCKTEKEENETHYRIKTWEEM